jgi:hypothetical protein
VALNVVVFVLGLASGEGSLQAASGQIAGLPGAFGVADGEYYRLLTAAFLHAGVFHILMNMFALAQLGPVLEAALGRLRFTALYVLSALGGSVLSYLLSEPFQLGVGASGAIFGPLRCLLRRRRAARRRDAVHRDPAGDQPGHHLRRADHRLAGPPGGLVTGAVVAAASRTPRGGAARTRPGPSPAPPVALVLAAAVVARTSALGG